MSNNYPLTTNHFQVEMGTTRLSFTEVSGLSIVHDVVETREGDSKVSSPFLMPGARKGGRLVLRRGIVAGDNELYLWMNTVNFTKVERRDVVIKLLNENHEPVVIWRAINVWPVRLDGPVLNANSCEVAIESIELAYESLRIEHA